MVLLDQVWLPLQGSMDRVEGEHQQEWLVGALAEKAHGFVGKPSRKVLLLGAIAQLGIVIGREVPSGRGTLFVSADVDVIALLFGVKALAAEMPLASKERFVPLLRQHLRQSFFLQW